MNKTYHLEVMPGAPSKWQVIGPDGQMVGEFSGRGAEANAVTLCGLLNHAFDLGMSAAMQGKPACQIGLVGGGPLEYNAGVNP